MFTFQLLIGRVVWQTGTTATTTRLLFGKRQVSREFALRF
jgi:hypothetical protein